MNDSLSHQPLQCDPHISPPPSDDESTRSISHRTPISPGSTHRYSSTDNQFLRPQPTAHLAASRDEYDGQSLSEQPLLSTSSPPLQPAEPPRLSAPRDEWRGRAPVDEYFSGGPVSPDNLSDCEEPYLQGGATTYVDDRGSILCSLCKIHADHYHSHFPTHSTS
jgi:hypothetical protein